mmetsp:Transcript_16470/g.22857  ORF Transcript_16470/g.22857 Transcript_16470/m.22857 type:complete len:421 (-) Transcript_16470:1918-3180(-)
MDKEGTSTNSPTKSTTTNHSESPSSAETRRGGIPTTRHPHENLAPLAVDIGGSFTKLVYWRLAHPPDLPNYIIKEFQDGEPKIPLKPDPSLKIHLSEGGHEGSLKFLKFPSNKTAEFIEFVLAHNLHHSYGKENTNTVVATGGGAYKYSNLVKEKLGITFFPQDEMQALISGLNFCLLHVDNEAFTYSWTDEKQHFVSGKVQQKEDPKFPFPYLVVNIGSGVSILRVDDENHFERVSGTSLGGGTFWGLARLLTDIQSFSDVPELSNKGENRFVDLLVGDIYGGDYDMLGLKADVIASSFGKAATHPTNQPYRKEDIVKSLLFMISNNIAQIGYLNARIYGVKHIFFSGGFLTENPYVWARLSYGVDFWSKGEMKALFLSHNTYLGALGALLAHALPDLHSPVPEHIRHNNNHEHPPAEH